MKLKKLYVKLLLLLSIIFSVCCLTACNNQQSPLTDHLLASFNYEVQDEKIIIMGAKDKKVKELTIPDCVNEINNGAFWGCYNLEKVTIGENSKLTHIEMDAFYGCDKLQKINLPKSLEKIGESAFQGCESLTEITIPENVTDISYSAFRNCFKLKKITISENSKLASIQANAFSSCINLQQITFPASLKSIGDEAFSACWGISEVIIPSTIEQIGANAFLEDYSLIIYCEEKEKPVGWADSWNFRYLNETNDKLTVVWDYRNNNVAEDGRLYVTIDGINYSLKDGEVFVSRQNVNIERANLPCYVEYNNENYPVTCIVDEAFLYCQQLTSATIPSSIQKIGSAVYKYCDNLTEINYQGSIDDWVAIDFEQSVFFYSGSLLIANEQPVYELSFTTATKISSHAFGYYQRLLKVEIPSTVVEIGEFAFEDCSSTTIYCEPSSRPQGWHENFCYPSDIVWDYENNDVSINEKVYFSMDDVNYYLVDGEAYVYRQSQDTTSVTIPTSINYKDKEYPVVGIDPMAWYLCPEFKDINYLGSIEDWVSLKLLGGVFNEDTNLLINGQLVTQIKLNVNPLDYVFGGYKHLTKVELLDGVTQIGQCAFSGCSNLAEVVLPSYLNSIGLGVFADCTSLKNIAIPSSVQSIQASAFSGCFALSTFDIPTNSQLNLIERQAFKSCNSLPSITLPKGLTTIEKEAFSFCEYLTIYCQAQTRPKSWDKKWKTEMITVVWNCDENDLDKDGFAYTVIDDLKYSLKNGCATLLGCLKETSSVVIPSSITYRNQQYSVTKIASIQRVWDSRLSVVSVTIPDSVTEIEQNAFYCFSNLEKVDIGKDSKLNKIGSAAFYLCEKLQELFIPISVDVIEAFCFSRCDALTIYCQAPEKPPYWKYDWNEHNCTVVWAYNPD